MPTVMTHAAVGLGLAAVIRVAHRPWRFWTLSAILPVLPDLDVVTLALGVPWGTVWSHRGLTHSLPCAAIVGAVAAALYGAHTPANRGWLALYFFLVTASHGVLDAFTNGGPGIAFFAPFDDGRYLFPWRPIVVSPLGLGFFSEWGARTMASELAWIWTPTAVLVTAVWLGRRVRG